ncbi:MAG: DUF1573 domain-containing protein [FCB group bacterium]|nr:DUF1573 domain-containing protein [FCB group bacterium]
MMMKYNSIFLMIIIFLFPFLTVTANPAFQLSETTFNFGKTAQHIKVNHTFWIKSTGNDTLRITKIVPGCGCTQIPLKDSVLAPGDSVALDIILSTRSYRGYLAKRPYFITNASSEKQYLKIFADLLPKPEESQPVTVKPFKVDVSQFTKLARRRAKFLIVNKSDRDFKIKLIDGNNKDFDVTLPNKVKAGETAEGMIEVHKDAIKKSFEQSFTFQINDDQQSRFTVPVRREYKILIKDK